MDTIALNISSSFFLQLLLLTMGDGMEYHLGQLVSAVPVVSLQPANSLAGQYEKQRQLDAVQALLSNN